MSKFFRACAVAAAVMTSGSASAGTFSFSYVFDSFASILGSMTGSVSAGVLTVDSVAAKISSTGGNLGVMEFDFDTALGGFHISGNSDFDPGTLALDGTFFDLAVIGLPKGNNCFNAPGFCLVSTFASAATGSAFSEYTLDESSFKISVIPLPATLPLLAGVLGVFGLMFRRRKGQSYVAA